MKRLEFTDTVKRLPRRPDNAHKGTMGTLCAVTGSRGFSGAAALSAKAALRSGVGLMYQILPEYIYPVFASGVYESVCVPVRGNEKGTVSREDIPDILRCTAKATAVLIGCGMGNNPDTAAVLEAVIENTKVPIIIDADGINALAEHIYLLERAKADIILTPHVKEFSRLTGASVEDILKRPAEHAADFAAKHPGVTLVLKGHLTYIASGGELYENADGNSGMAKGGSGDVLAGIIASLAAQGVPALDAAAAGVHIHALAGDIAAEKLSKTAMLPTDIISSLPQIFKEAEALLS